VLVTDLIRDSPLRARTEQDDRRFLDRPGAQIRGADGLPAFQAAQAVFEGLIRSFFLAFRHTPPMVAVERMTITRLTLALVAVAAAVLQ
jgi:hypothetical protein